MSKTLNAIKHLLSKKNLVVFTNLGELKEILASGAPVIASTPDRACRLCSKVAETRPYGPNGEEVCFVCGMKDETAIQKGMAKRLGFHVPQSSKIQ